MDEGSELDEDDQSGSLDSDDDNLYESGDDPEDRINERKLKSHVGRVTDVIKKGDYNN